jgi:predicted TPR repeat methyltransferase
MTPAQQQSRDIFFQGIAHFEAGRLAPARECFERCQALTPGRPSVQGNLGITLWRLGHAAEALPLLQQACAGEPAFADAWAALGLAQASLGHWPAALDALTRAVALNERAAPLHFSRAQCLARLGRAPEALQALDRALALDPDSAPAWSLRGGLLREMRRLDDAARSYEQAIALGADRELHAYYLASVRGSATPPASAPRAYVQALFDDYAADFQGHLVEQLGYRGHEALLRPLLADAAARGRRFAGALDLGCGTGLCAPLLAGHCDAIDGVDLSAAMLEQARQRGLYRTLVQADIAEYLATMTQRADLVVAADVLIYVGELAPVFDATARLLLPGGLFAFTVELPRDGSDLQLLPSLRYAHSQAYVQRCAADAGLAVQSVREATIRHEQGAPVAGLCVVLQRTGDAR